MRMIPKSFIRDYFLTALVFVLLGVLFLACPETSGKIICYIFGGFLCLLGLARTIEYFMAPVTLSGYSLGLVAGLIFAGCGIFVLVRPETIIKVLPTVLGIAILLDSLIKLQNAADMIKIRDKSWQYTLVMALVTAVLGVLMIVNPFKAMETLLQFLGIALIANGVIDAAALLIFYSRIKKSLNIKETNTSEI
ncbi:MAG: hypothetical protein GX488_09275 [Clostridiales bacterium]|nr:hypothetical protein [Clostridiales bacterium]